MQHHRPFSMQSTIEQLDVVLSSDQKDTKKPNSVLLKNFDDKKSKKDINNSNSNLKSLTSFESNEIKQTPSKNVVATNIHPFATLQRNSSIVLSSIKNNTGLNKNITKPSNGLLQAFNKLHTNSELISKPQSENYSTPTETINKLSEKNDINCRIVRAQSLRDITYKFDQKPETLATNNLQQQSINSFNFSKKLNENEVIKETSKRFSLLEASSSTSTSDYLDSVDYTKLHHHHQPNSSSVTPAINKEYIIELHRKLAGYFLLF